MEDKTTARETKDGYRRAFLIIMTAVIVLSIISYMIAYYTYTRQSYAVQDTETISRQFKKLDNISESLKSLESFISDQRENLVEESIALENLKNEKKALEPLVEGDRRVIESIFLQQEKRQQRNVWWERGFGFFAGILASVIASVIYALLVKWWEKSSKKK